jgi:diguanylate cyclase (GGDEF)-like protein
MYSSFTRHDQDYMIIMATGIVTLILFWIDTGLSRGELDGYPYLFALVGAAFIGIRYIAFTLAALLIGLSIVGFQLSSFDPDGYIKEYIGYLNLVISSTCLLILATIIEYGRSIRLQLDVANKSLEQLSLHDGLTGLANRRFFDRYLAEQVAIARRYKRTLALVMYDIDFFKAYNDHYGHQAGDECLRQIGAALLSCCRRPADMMARYGGEEFAMILPDTELVGAAQIAEAAREAVARLKIPHAHSAVGPYVSISGGVAVLRRTTDTTVQQLIAAADRTLYQAKNLGRDRMVSVQAELAEGHV